jgi:carbon monoxide dehydrogenase subunit G
MPETTNTVEIARPPAQIVAFLADPTNDPQWRAGVVDIRPRSGSGEGTIYEQRIKGPFGL